MNGKNLESEYMAAKERWSQWTGLNELKKKMRHKDRAIVDSSALYLEQLI